jgi:hypothetical protein
VPVNDLTLRETSPDDPRAPIVDQGTVAQIAELELRRAIRLQYYASALALQIDTDEPELPKRVSSYRPYSLKPYATRSGLPTC